MKKITPTILLAFLLTSCSGWIIQPLPYTPPTPFLPFTQTPSIFTATPVVIGVNSSTPAVVTLTPSVTTFPTLTLTFTPPAVIISDTPSPTVSVPPIGGPAVSVVVLGCNTSIDISHGMGEVTNAFVTLKNTGGLELTNLRVTLFALDEGREHPDKTIELSSLPVGYQVSIKLTVDSTYKQETPIQVAVVSDQAVFPREGRASCKDIGVFAPNPNGLNTPVPASP
jgi:hypothetical protein